MKTKDLEVGVRYKLRGQWDSTPVVILDPRPVYHEHRTWQGTVIREGSYGTKGLLAARQGYGENWYPCVVQPGQIRSTYDAYQAEQAVKADAAKAERQRRDEALKAGSEAADNLRLRLEDLLDGAIVTYDESRVQVRLTHQGARDFARFLRNAV